MLTAISPVDGRYQSKTSVLTPYFSEFGLIKYRTKVEILYFIALVRYGIPQLKTFPSQKIDNLKKIYQGFSEDDALEIKSIEKTTNHDVKAVEYFIKNKFDKLDLNVYKEFIHFGLTSQDINNTSIPLSLRDALNEVILPKLEQILALILTKVDEYLAIPMLSRTHGQAASPTLLGKEWKVFAIRLGEQLSHLRQLKVKAKFGGAVGNFNAHFVAYPKYDWIEFGNQFVANELGLERSQVTTQIDHYDNIAEHMHAISRIATILIDLCRDVWTYISRDFFKQKLVAGEIGSSTMPHKVNPIDFENAEGNLGMVRAVAQFLANKLPISRMQRDLTDSTVLRNLGVPYGHLIIALESIQKGINKLEVNESAIHADLEKNWVVVAEAIQTILRREGIPNPYELLKGITRGVDLINQQTFANFIDGLPVENNIKEELKAITPWNYVGKVG